MNNNKYLKILTSILILLALNTNAINSAFKTKLKSKSTQGSLILLDQKAKAIIQGPYAEIEYIQTHNNPYDFALDIEFYFPLPENSLFHQFEAIFHKRNNNNAIEFSLSKPVHIGMIQAHENVEIRFSFLQPLDVIVNRFWGFNLQYPFTEDPIDPSQGLNLQTMDLKHLCKGWEIEVKIKSDQPFQDVRNPSHHLKPSISDSNFYQAVWKATVEINKDFVVYFRSDKIESPSTILATHPDYPNDHVLLINSIPQLNEIPKGEEEFSYLINQVRKNAIHNSKGEFIFLIDCSDSMQGEKIASLRKTLQHFLTILPHDSYFNIICFGSTFSIYSRESLQSTPLNLWKARAWVYLIDADLGYPEFFPALEQATRTPVTEGYPRAVVLLTNGIMTEPKQLINHIRKNAEHTRVCDVRIGPNALKFLINEIGKAGRCASELISDNINEKAMNLIHAAISPYLEKIHFSIQCFNSQNQLCFSEGSKQKILLKDEPLKKWVYLQNISDIEYCNANVSYLNSLTKEQVIKEIQIDGSKSTQITSIWHKIAYNSKIEELRENAADWNFQFTERRVKEFAIRYQIFSDYANSLLVKKRGYPRFEAWQTFDHMVEILKAKEFDQPFQLMEFFYIGFWIFFICRHFSRKDGIKNGSRKENYDEIVRRLTHKTD